MSELGNIEDRSKVRTAEDVERKYHLGRLVENQEINENQIINLETELNNFVDATTQNFEDVQEQLDGKVETWYYSGIPSLSNLPASDWTTNDEKDKHIGDLYYDQSTGYVYRFELDNNVYKWQEIHDKNATDALSIANNALDTADGKKRVFMVQPTPPYDNGDLWVQGSNGDIKVCQISRQTGSYVATDWIIASKYTDNTYASAIVDELGGTTTTILSGQVVQEMANYTKFTDLSTGGSTTIAGENITTGSIKSQNYVQDVSGTKINLVDGSIDSKNFKVDQYGNVTCNQIEINDGEIGNLNFILRENDTNRFAYLLPGAINFEREFTNYVEYINLHNDYDDDLPIAYLEMGKSTSNPYSKSNGVLIQSSMDTGLIMLAHNGNNTISLDGETGQIESNGVPVDTPVVLYETSGGTTGNVTLSDNITNYRKIKVYGWDNGSNNVLTSNEFYTYKQNNVVVQVSYVTNGNGIVYPCGSTYEIVDTSMNFQYHYRAGIYGSNIGYQSGTNYYKIMRIEGFK